MKIVIEESYAKIGISEDGTYLVIESEWSGESPEQCSISLQPQAAHALIHALMMQLDNLTGQKEEGYELQ